MSSRPRITFDQEGKCNACSWSKEKLSIDWQGRRKQLMNKLGEIGRGKSEYDCLVPVSGGKDSSYVTMSVIEKLGLKPLCVTVRPPLETITGISNLMNFLEISGVDHLHITPSQKDMMLINRAGFKEAGQGYYGWLTAISSAIIKTAIDFKIPIIFYGENGELEYGGSSDMKNKLFFDIDFILDKYLSGQHTEILKASGASASSHYSFDQFKNIEKTNFPLLTHWSSFEPWDSYRNYVVAKERFGLGENTEASSGTFTNFAQTDQVLCDLHYYLMYVKFGFGRATQDAGIEIRRGAMSRQQGLELVKLYDGEPPSEKAIDSICNYFEISQSTYYDWINRHANKKLFTTSADTYPTATVELPLT